MAGDIELGVRLTADGRGLSGEVRGADRDMDKLGNTTQTTGSKSKRAGSLISGMGGAIRKSRAGIKGLSDQLFSLKGLLVGLGVGATAKSFLEAASTAEQYKVRLQVLLGSQAEGNRLFDEMADFASKVPFEYEKIMGSATQLSGVMKGGVDEIKQWMPLISDLAATSGLSIEQTTEQVVRMYSSGAGAADLFREKGITAMLGFEAGVSVSAEDTRKKLMEEWTKMDSQFRGASELLAGTWDGMMSMMGDKWFKFRTRLMDAGLFDYLKSIVQVFNRDMDKAMDGSKDSAGKWANAIIDGIESALGAVGVFINGIHSIRIIFKAVEVVFYGFVAAMATGFSWLNTAIVGMVNGILGGVKIVLKLLARVSDKAKKAVEGIDDLQASFTQGKDFFDGFAKATRESTSAVLDEMKDLAQFLPGDIIKGKLEEIRAQFELNRKKSKEAAKDTKKDTKETGNAIIDLSQDVAFLSDAYVDLGKKAKQQFSSIESASSSAASAFEDDWIESIKNAEFSFRSFVDSVINELLRLQYEMAIGSSTSDFLASLFGAAVGATPSPVPAIANPGDGDIATFSSAGVASRGPTTARADSATVATSVTIIQENDFSNVSSTDVPRLQAMLDQNKEQTKAEVFNAINRGGAAARITGRR